MRPMTKRETATATVAAIRAKYPNPERRDDINDWCEHDGAHYCVGGAYALFYGRTRPGFEMMGSPQCIYAMALVLANEAGDFERAWQLLEDILAA